MEPIKSVLFIHYRVGERDGVGLEIEKRANAVKSLQGEVRYLCGYDGLSRQEATVLPELDLKNPEVDSFRHKLYEGSEVSEDDLKEQCRQKEQVIYDKLVAYFANYSPDLIFVHNFFSYGYNLPATTAFTKFFAQSSLKIIALHHDFWFEREKFSNSPYPFVQEILEGLPPKMEAIFKHQVINSLAQEEMLKRRDIKAERIGDSFDFGAPIPLKDAFNSDLKTKLGIPEKNILLLQATRITERKGIENAILFAHQLNKKLETIEAFTFGGRTIDNTSRATVLFSNFVMVDSAAYFEKLKKLATELDVHLVSAGDSFDLVRSEADGKKIYTFWDAYLFSDFVTYPSTWEGFGNQFLEAIYFHQLSVVYEYPVFLKDIKPEGYDYISLGSQVNERDGLFFVDEATVDHAVQQLLELMHAPAKLTASLLKNLQTATTHHDESLLLESIRRTLYE